MKKKTLWIILAAVLVAAAVAVSLFFILRKTGETAAGDDDIDHTTDSDGDGIPDYLDKEADDDLSKDNVVDIGDLFD